MAKFDKDALIGRLQVKRQEAVNHAARLTTKAEGEFPDWKAKKVADAEAKLRSAKALKFGPTDMYDSSRPVPHVAVTVGIDKAITELQCMAGDTIVLTPSSNVLALL